MHTPSPPRAPHQPGRAAWALAAAATLLGACSSLTPAPGQTEADLRAAWGAPSASHTLAPGQRQLEYATGPFGRTTWMLTVDAKGVVQDARQVLNEASFLDFQTRSPGMDREQVRLTLGRPGDVQPLGWIGGEIWSWRYPNNDCLWFQATLDAQGRVTGSGYAPDPVCDAPGDHV